MRQGIDLERIYAVVRVQVRGLTIDSRPPGPIPEANPFALDTLLRLDLTAIEAELRGGLEGN